MRNLLIGMAAVALAAPLMAQTTQPTTAAEYVPAAGASDLYERMSSQIVLKDAKRPAVKKFAQMMIGDHAKTTAQVKAAAKKSGMTPPEPMLMPDQQAMIDQLNSAPADQREQVYLTQQVTAHQQALALHQSYAASGDQPALKKVAATAVPIVQHHLDEVQRLASAQ